MKNWIICLFIGFAGVLNAQTSATYTAGVIGTEYDANPVSTALMSSCADTLVVNIPPGDYVTGLDLSYDMTSTSGGWMSEQYSYLECVSTGQKEASLANGTGNNSGTFSYARNGLALANGLSASGEFKFVLHGFRSWGSTGQCNSVVASIDNNSWTITLQHGPPPSCFAPTAFQLDAVSSATATLSWNSGGATNWQLAYGPQGSAPISGTVVTAAATPFNLSGLTPSTSYDIYVRDSCGPGDVSSWVGPLSLTTTCPAVAAPYIENFDANFNEGTGPDNNGSTIDTCWSRNPAVGYHWGGGQGGTGTGNTGPSADHTTGNGNYVYAEASFTTPGLTAELESPEIDLSALSVPELRFWFHMYGSSMGTLQLDVFDGSSWTTNVDQISGDQGDQWFERIVDLSAFAGQTVRLRFVASTGVTPTQLGDIAIDDLSIQEAPSCPAPTNLQLLSVGSDKATLFWTPGTAANWNLQFGAPGFALGTGTFANATATTFTLNGLSPNTAYEVYVRDSCGTGDVSAWLGPLTLLTNCLPVAAPFLEDFDGTAWTPGVAGNNANNAIDGCWRRDPGSAVTGTNVFSWGTRQGATGSANTGPASDHTSGSGNYLYTEASGSPAGSEAELITVPVDCSPLTTPELRFWYHMAGASMGSLEVFVDNGSGYTSVFSISGAQQTAVNDPWTEAIVSLAAYAGDTLSIRFEGTRGGGFTSDIAIDDVTVDEAPSCPQPTFLLVDQVSSNSVDLSWTTGGSALWQIEYGPVGFTPGTGSVVTATSNPFSLTGLNASTSYEFYVRDSCGVGDVSAWTGPVAATTNCPPYIAPFTEDFENGSWTAGGTFDPGTIDSCWTRNASTNYWWKGSSGATPTTGTGPTGDHTSGSGSYMYTETNSSNVLSTEILSPEIDLSALSAPELRFWYHMFGGLIDQLEVFVESAGTSTSVSLISGAQQSANADPWLQEIVDLSAFIGSSIQLRFVASRNPGFNNQVDISIDDLSVDEAPTCPEPSGLAALTSTATSIDLTWVTGGSSNWQIEYGPAGFTLGTGVQVSVQTNPYTLTGLAPSTTYDIYVRDSCGPGDVSIWVGPLTFTTPCVAAVAPYSEDFDGSSWVAGAGGANANNSIDPCWSRNPATGFHWGTRQFATGSTNTGPSGDHTSGSGNYIYTEASGSGAGSIAELESPQIDCSALTNPELRFWYHMFGGGMGDLDVQVDDGSGFVSVFSLNGQQQTSSAALWQEAIVSLSAYAGSTITIRFEGTRGFGFTSDMAVDDVSLDEAPACPAPTAFALVASTATTVELSWTSGGATNWQIEYGPAGFTPGSGSVVSAAANPFTVTGLNPSTSYDFYVRDSCAAGSVSLWTGPLTASTACAAIAAPYTEDFNSGVWVTGTGATNENDLIDPCWTRNPNGNSPGVPTAFSWGTGSGGTASNGTGPASGNGGSGNYVYSEASGVNNGSRAYLFSPSIDLSALTNPELEFWYHMFGGDIDSLTVEVDDGSGYSFLTAIVGQQQTSDAAAWIPVNLSLSAYSGSTVQIRFQTERLGFEGDIAIDDFSVQNAAACPQPFNLSISSTSSTSIELNWTTGGAANAQIEYGPVGFTPGTGTIIGVGAPPQIVTGLNPSTTYSFYVRDSCGPGSVSSWTGPVNGSTDCPTFAAPYFEDFENGAWNRNGHFDPGTIDSCWNRSTTDDYWWKGGDGATPTTGAGPSGDHTTGNGSYMYTETGSSNVLSTEILSPEIDLSALTAPELRFWYHMFGGLIDELEVFVEQGGNSSSVALITGAQQSGQADPWLEQIVDLTAFSGTTIKLRFVGNRNPGFNNQVDISIDDISIDEPPACPAPTALAAANATTTSIDISWTSGGAANWQIEYGPVGFAPGTGTIVNATSNPFTLTGLSPSSGYHVYVRDSCGQGSVSAWAGPLTANTACGTAVAPYFQNFDAGFDEGTGTTNTGSTIDPCWSRNPTTGYHWGGGQGGTGTPNTGPSGDHTSGFGNYVYAEASFTNPGLTAELETPDVDLSPLTLPELRFWYHMFGGSTGELRVDVFDGTNWVNGVDTIIGEQGNQWFERRILLPSFAGQTVRIRFTASTGTAPTQFGDIAIDDLSIIEGPTCPFPTLLTSTAQTNNSVTLSWTTGGATNWQIEYGPVGFTPGAGTLVNAGTNPFTVNGLNPSTTYDFYVRDSCGAGDVSDWEGPLTQNTTCGILAAPYFQNFDAGFDEGTGTTNTGSTIDPCWSRNPATGYHWGGGQGGTGTPNTGPSADHTTGNGNYVYAEASFTNPGLTAELETPDIDLSALNVPELRFWYHMYGGSTGDLQVDIYDGTNWNTNVDLISGEQGNQWFERIVNLAAYAGQTIRVRFVSSTGTTPTQFGDIAIDDFQIDEAPSCPDPSGLTTASVGSTSIQLAWTSGGASNWQIEYGPAGFTPGTGTIVSANTNPFLITGLSATTSYSFYVRDSCGPADYSQWIGPLDVTTFGCSNGCFFNLRLTDSFGDGWSTNSGGFHQVELILNGGTPTQYSMANGSLQDYSIQLCDGDQVQLNFINAGTWSDECGIIFSDPAGAIVYQLIPGNAVPTSTLYTDSADCGPGPQCADPTGLSIQNIGLNSADVAFNSNSGISRIEFGPAGFTPGTGTLIALVTTSPFTITGLTPGTNYDVYVQDSCGIAVTSNWVGPVSFTATPCPPVTANFTITTSGTSISVDGTSSTGSFFSWDFGGQGASFDSIASFSFASEGTYTITLVNSSGCGTSDILSITVDLCDTLTAAFTSSTTYLDAQFNSVGSSGTPTSIQWDFGDGTTGSGVVANHTYTMEGLYDVWLILTNACGQVDSVMQQIRVCDVVSGNIAYTFSGTTFNFDASGSSPNAVTFRWYFGDGATDTLASPSHTYTGSGNYTVSLVVFNACGDSDSVLTQIQVCPKPTASWTFTVIQSSPLGMQVQFDASSSVGAVSYFWDFGDGNTNSTSGFPIHTYATPGFFYVVTLITYNSCGDSDTLFAPLSAVGTGEWTDPVSLEVFPNPTRSSVFISWQDLPNDDAVVIELLDVSGKLVRSIQADIVRGGMEAEMKLEDLPSAVYQIRLRQGNREAVRRLIKD